MFFSLIPPPWTKSNHILFLFSLASSRLGSAPISRIWIEDFTHIQDVFVSIAKFPKQRYLGIIVKFAWFEFGPIPQFLTNFRSGRARRISFYCSNVVRLPHESSEGMIILSRLKGSFALIFPTDSAATIIQHVSVGADWKKGYGARKSSSLTFFSSAAVILAITKFYSW